MKKALIAVGLMLIGVSAADPGPFGGLAQGLDGFGDYKRGAEWTVFQLQLLPVYPFRLFHERTANYGLAVNVWGNIWGDYGNNYGLSLNGYAEGGHNYGIGLGVYQKFRRNSGLTIGIFNGVAYGNYGLQAGVINFCSNGSYVPGTVNGNTGVQFGLVNICDEIRDEYGEGGKVTAVHPVENNLQIGVWNQADSGWQFGLLNHNRRSPIPWMIFANYSAPADAADDSSPDSCAGGCYVID